ncbi:hypothetical protein [Streptomyces sp. NPDC093707]|uniref:hypothetical protein n=1 Tax=Streptomyces sp. NPDC093707 TaxID=3154984 RepID=UPI00344C59A3
MDSTLMVNVEPRGESPIADPVEEFRGIVCDALDTAEETYGVEDLECHLERALVVLQRNPELRPQFESELVSLLDSIKEGVIEVVSYAMHELRWPAVERAIREKISVPGVDVSDVRLYGVMLEAFSDSWRDRDLYGRFSR